MKNIVSKAFLPGWIAAAALTAASPARAEPQKVEAGGQITILGEYYRNVETAGDGLRWPSSWLIGRPAGNGPGIFSGFGWDKHGHDLSVVSQWTRLHLNAEFTDDTRAFIELDSVNVWGDDFRADGITGADHRGDASEETELYQAYIEADTIFGAPLRLRLGRQELLFGSGWLVGPNDDGPAPAWGLSFDAARLTYAAPLFSIDLWAAKLAERSPNEMDGDADFYGLYASFFGLEDIVFDAYWMMLRDAVALRDTQASPAVEALEAALGRDDYETTRLHTAGLRAAGALGAFDFDVEAAYQFGGAGQPGALFRPVLYGDNGAEFDAWGCNAQLGYQFDTVWQPHVYAVYAFLGGEDNRAVSFREWAEALLNPFHRGQASLSFNRLFSNYSYSAILDGTDLSNAHIFHLGASASPREYLELAIDLGYYRADKAFARPVVPWLTFWTKSNDPDLGWELDANLTYRYSADIEFCVGWDHLFTGKGLEQGQFTQANGLDFNGGTGQEDADYFYFETALSF